MSEATPPVTPPATPPATPPTTPPATPPATPPSAAWHGITDAESVAYLANKGWTSPADIVKSYQGAEKLIGRDPSTLVALPRADDADGTRQVFTKLGRPEKPDAYDVRTGLPKDAKVDEGFAKAMQGMFHNADLTAGQATKLAGEYNAFALEAATKAQKDYETSVAADKLALQDKWRGGHDRMIERAKTAAKNLGFTPEVLEGLEKQVGYAKVYEMFAEIGGKLGEDPLLGVNKGEPKFNTGMTPDEAKVQWDAKKLDANFMAALRDKSHPGHAVAQKTQTDLFAIMFPSSKAA